MPTDPESTTTSRKPRADAQRNRLRLLETARAVFADKGADASLDAIARATGVGIGTLYRHFPTRDALVEEVYRNATQQLADAATTLAEAYPPVEALRQWMRLFVDHLATKRVMAEALNALVGGTSELYAASGTQMKAAIALLVDRAVVSGDIQLSVEPLDLLRALAGVANVGSGPHWEESAKRLVDILIAGVRAPAGHA
ncbi:MAG TPA: TetR/AcrR family transcriptional regulator [Sphingomonas sp.]|nr:TetR/AcrR family transcriptional regulator [Sphingomonas sp.]